MLGSLLVAAVVGAASVLLGQTTVVYRTEGTLVVTAISAALLLWVSKKLNQPAARESALLSTTIVIAEFLVCLTAIWQVFGIDGLKSLQLMLCLAAAGIPATLFLRHRVHPQGRVASVAGLALCTIVFLLWLLAVETNAGSQLWEYANTLAVLGLLAVLCLVGVGKDRRHWRWLGIAAAVAAGAMGFRYIALESTEVSPLVAWLIGIAVVAAHANLVLGCPLKPNQRWLAYGCIAAVIVAVVCTDLAITQEHPWSSSATWPYNGNGASIVGIDGPDLERYAAAAGIIAACGTLALAVVLRLNQRIAQPNATVEATEITLFCPICQRKQTVAKSGGDCAGCGLHIQITTTEPRCAACGYSLLMLKSDRCPECGAPRAAAMVTPVEAAPLPAAGLPQRA